MWTFNQVFGKIFDLLFIPFRDMNPWVGMIIVSFLTGLLMENRRSNLQFVQRARMLFTNCAVSALVMRRLTSADDRAREPHVQLPP